MRCPSCDTWSALRSVVGRHHWTTSKGAYMCGL